MKPVSGVPGVDFTVEDVRGEFPDELEIKPLENPVDATVRVPGSKSVTNRALIVAALADGDSTIINPLFSDDSYWLLDALTNLGFSVSADHGYANPGQSEIRIRGVAGSIPNSEVDMKVYVGNAGTAARFLPPFLALGEGEYHLDGTPRMRERPVKDLVDALRQLGGKIEYGGIEGRFPLVVSGSGLKGGVARVEGSKSSQFLSGLLMAAPYAEDKTILQLEGKLVSRPYVGITLNVMKTFGAIVNADDQNGSYEIFPGIYEAREYVVEPDASAASYFMAAAAVTGGRIKIPGLGKHTSQGDMRFLQVLEQMGCNVKLGQDYVEVRGPRKLRGVKVDMNDFSDTMMTLAAIAPFAEGETHITNIEHTRYQETDRISAVATELGRIGVGIEERKDFLRIIPKKVWPTAISTYGDHRMAMAFALVGLMVPGIWIRDPGCVTKTFPEYFARLGSLHRAVR